MMDLKDITPEMRTALLRALENGGSVRGDFCTVAMAMDLAGYGFIYTANTCAPLTSNGRLLAQALEENTELQARRGNEVMRDIELGFRYGTCHDDEHQENERLRAQLEAAQAPRSCAYCDVCIVPENADIPESYCVDCGPHGPSDDGTREDTGEHWSESGPRSPVQAAERWVPVEDCGELEDDTRYLCRWDGSDVYRPVVYDRKRKYATGNLIEKEKRDWELYPAPTHILCRPDGTAIRITEAS